MEAKQFKAITLIMKKRPRLTFIEALIDGLWIHKSEDGRSRRSEFWWCFLFLFIVSTCADILMFLLQNSTIFYNEYIETASVLLNVYIAGAFAILLRRRLNDTGRPQMFYVFVMLVCATITLGIVHWWKENKIFEILFLISAIATLASLAICLWQCTRDSEKRSNRYGKSPKYVDEYTDIRIDTPQC